MNTGLVKTTPIWSHQITTMLHCFDDFMPLQDKIAFLRFTIKDLAEDIASLKIVLLERAVLINLEKLKPDVGSDVLIFMQSGIVALTKEIAEKQKKLKALSLAELNIVFKANAINDKFTNLWVRFPKWNGWSERWQEKLTPYVPEIHDLLKEIHDIMNEKASFSYNATSNFIDYDVYLISSEEINLKAITPQQIIAYIVAQVLEVTA